jgi:CSLREA domain-containing protein
MRTSTAVLLLALAWAGAVEGQNTFVVNSAVDAVDAALGINGCETAVPGECTLRAAIMEANFSPGPDTVTFDPLTNGTPFILSRPCHPINGCTNDFFPGSDGDLDVFDDLLITGNGPAATVILGSLPPGTAVDRVLQAFASLTISGVTIQFGSASEDGQGGAIASHAPLTVTDSVISENEAFNVNGFGNGGGIYSGGDLTLSRVTIRGNGASTGGGVYWATRDNLISITDSTFEANRAAGGSATGGALHSSLFGPNAPVIVVSNTTFSGNTAGNGCAIYHENAPLRLHSVTVSDNCVPGSGTAALVATYGDGSGNLGGEVLLKNSILASPPGTDNCRVETLHGVPPGFFSEGHNLASDATCGLVMTGDVQGANPVLGPLADNGGPTRTHLPFPGSPAIDTGTPDCLPSDQRGLGRPSDGGSGVAVCDKGSVEVAAAPPPPPPTTASIQGTAWNDDNFNTMREPPGEAGTPGVQVCLFPTAPTQCTVTGPDGSYAFSNLTPGSYHVYIRVPDGRLSSTPRAQLVNAVAGTATSGVDFGTFVPPPPPPPSPSQPPWDRPLVGQEIRKGPTFFVRVTAPCAATSLTATVTYAGPLVVSRAMTFDASTNTWEVVFDTPGGPGLMPVRIEADCSTQAYSGFIEFIDPSGRILDGCTGEPLEGAIVTLQKNEPFGSDGYVVPDPAEHIPANNPFITAADGFYAWDVVPGRWRVQASKPGYDTVITDPFDVPPPKLDLDITLPRTAGCNVPPLADDDSYDAFEDVPLAVAAPGVLGNDSDANGESLRAVLASAPAHGSLSLELDGSFLYSPDPNFSGSDAFTYVAEDPAGAASNVANVTIAVAPVNDPPFAAGDSYGTSEGTPLTVAAPGVLGNDSDPDSPALNAALLTGPSNGTLSLSPDGSFTYTPNDGFEGTDGFTYQASDGVAASAPANVTIAVQFASAAGWTPTGSLTVARTRHTATLLPNGMVLVAGGFNSSGLLRSSELYDPASGTWSASGNLLIARSGHTATPLENGMVLVAGGIGRSGFLRSAELYDPSSGTWTQTSPLTAGRWGHTATLLLDGRVLVAGGGPRHAEIFDPASGKWSSAGNLGVARSGHSATLLSNGAVLVAGGLSGLKVLKSAELYDPSTGKWSPTGNLASARMLHSATELPGGGILIAGGVGANGAASSHAEVYERSTGTWTPTGSLDVARSLHTATLLPDGRVLAAAGFDRYLQPLDEAELYDPATGQWSTIESLGARRGNHTATLLPDGTVLVTGGGVLGLASAEVFASQ